MTYQLLATEVGEALKYDTTVNEVNRIGKAMFTFSCEEFPNDSITSVRSQLVYNWILSLAKQPIDEDEKRRVLIHFCDRITPQALGEKVHGILADNNVLSHQSGPRTQEFLARHFHATVIQHSKKLFLEENYFHAVFEAAKVYNYQVKQKSQSSKDGEGLMMDVWGWQAGVLKITPCKSDSDKNVQDGVKFLSSGLMRAIRNPTAHEPALDWPINREDCLDVLSFISFLFRQLDKAVYFP